MQTIRLGQIEFINCLPFNYALGELLKQAKSASAPLFLRLNSFEITSACPAVLNKLLYAGELDMAPISSIEYLRHRDRYHLFSEMAISSRREADSVLFLSKVPIAELKDVYVTDKSATSVALLKIILQKKYNLSGLNFIVAEHSPEAGSRGANSASKTSQNDSRYAGINMLLIGDDALVADKSAYPYVLDLGREWFEYSEGLPMVFGLWAYSKSFELKPRLKEVLMKLKEDGLGKYLPNVIALAAKQTGLAESQIRSYFEHLDYDFSGLHEKSLALFEKELF